MLRIKLLQQRGWVRRSAGDVSGALDDLKAMISCAEGAKQLRLEVSGLLDLSRLCVYADRRQCLKIAAWAVEKSEGLDDDGFKALVEGSRANLNLWLKNWSDEDAELCRKVLKMSAETRDPHVLIRRYSFETLLKFISSNYQDCCVAAKQGQEVAQALGDVFFFSLFSAGEMSALLHLGEWRHLRRNAAATLAMTQKNANQVASDLCLLMIAFLHVEALDFEGARQRCEETLDSMGEADPLNFFIGRTIGDVPLDVEKREAGVAD